MSNPPVPDQSPGTFKKVTSHSNPIVKAIKALHMKKVRDREGLFLAEGLKLVTDALEQGWQLDTLIYGTSANIDDLAARARNSGTKILEVSEKILAAISRKDNPQTVLGIFRQKLTPLGEINSGESPEKSLVWVGLDRVRDPGNLGTILRTVDAVGAQGVILIGDTTDPWSMETVRASMGSIFNVDLAVTSVADFATWVGKRDMQIVGTHLSGAVDYREVDYGAKPTLLLMGNEQRGLSDELVSLCDKTILIPQAGRADSLNLAIATGIMLFEIRRGELKMPVAT